MFLPTRKKLNRRLIPFTILLYFLTPNINAQTYLWQQSGGPYSGTIFSIAIDDNGVTYVGGELDGIFVSQPNNQGLRNTLPDVTGSDIGINLDHSVFVGTPEGIFRSSDFGISWQKVLSGRRIRAIGTDLNGNVFAGYSGVGIYFSSDNGTTWTLLHNGLPSNPSNNVEYIVVNSIGQLFASTFRGGIYRSDDNGNSWIYAGLDGLYIPELTVDINNNILAATENGVYRSTDNGNNWTLLNLNATYIYAIAVNSLGHIFAGNWDGLHLSTDDGLTWDLVGLPYTVYTLGINQYQDVLIGTREHGLYKSADNGTTWIQIGVPNIEIIDIAMNSKEWIFVGGFSKGIYRSNNGKTWNRVYNVFNISCIATKDSGYVFACVGTGVPSTIIRSTNNGSTWITTSSPQKPVEEFAVTVGGDIFAGTWTGIYYSNNNGQTWNYVGPENDFVFAMDIGSNGQIFAGVGNDIYLSNDNGNTWIKVFTVQGDYISTIFVFSENIIFAGTLSSSGSVFRSTDGGESWIQTNLINHSILSLTADTSGNMLAGVENTIFLSDDLGESWQNIGDGLPNNKISSISISPKNAIYAATANGVYKGTDSTIIAIKKQKKNTSNKFILMQNYPNPFNPITTINYRLPVGSEVELTIYNLLGQQIRTLVNRNQTVGSHEVQWDGRDESGKPVTSGIYFYQLKAENDFNETKKMVLMR